MDAGNLVGMDVMSLAEIGSFGKDELHKSHGNVEVFDDVKGMNGQCSSPGRHRFMDTGEV